jgi:hypothetical protein
VILGRSLRDFLREAQRAGGFTVRPVEGPPGLSPSDVARAMGAALGREVGAQEIPRDDWKSAFVGLGFSDGGARYYARMTAITVDEYAETSGP